jgi:hypothetical protein
MRAPLADRNGSAASLSRIVHFSGVTLILNIQLTIQECKCKDGEFWWRLRGERVAHSIPKNGTEWPLRNRSFLEGASLGTPISRLANCGAPIGRLAFPGVGLKRRSNLQFRLILVARTGVEPVIFALKGRRVNHYSIGPQRVARGEPSAWEF